MSSPDRRALAHGSLVLVLLLGSVAVTPPRPATSTGPSLLSPLRELGAQLLWIRFQRARLAGEGVRSLDLAERALGLDPSSSEGWEALAEHLAFDLASREREPDLARRRALFEAALEILHRGRTTARDPGALDFAEGLLWLAKAEADPALSTGGRAAMLLRAAEALERAAGPARQGAAELARLAREAATH